MITKHLHDAGVAHRIVGDATLFDILFLDRDVRDYRDVVQADTAANARFNKTLRAMGIFKSPGKLYPSLAITEEDLVMTDMALKAAASAVAEG